MAVITFVVNNTDQRGVILIAANMLN